MLKSIISTISITLLLASVSLSVNASAYPSSYTTKQDPAQHIAKAVNKIKGFNTSPKKAPPDVIKGFLEKEIIPLFDFETMANWIVGPYARYMTKADKIEFFSELR